MKYLAYTFWIFVGITSVLADPSIVEGVTQPPLNIFREPNNQLHRSVLFTRLRDQVILYQEHPNDLLIPASVAKLTTAAACLHYLGPQYQFKTPIYMSGTRKDYMIKGHLIVKGSGDPLLISEKLWQLAADIRHMGIRTITGNIIIDNSLFDGEYRDSSRLSAMERSNHAYDAPLSAFGVNFNTYTIAMAPADKIGERAIVEFDPYPLQGLQIQNQSRTVRDQFGIRPQVARIGGMDQRASLLVQGAIPIQGSLKKIYRSVGDPVRAAGEQLRAFLKKEGIIVQGQVQSGKVPSHAKLLTTLEGFELRRIIEGLNKFSNNFIADTLVKKLALNQGAKQGNQIDGIKAISDFLRQNVGIHSEFTLANGSGLDPRSRLSAQQLVQVLSYMEHRFDLYPEFLNSLPAAGFDGTMEHRFNSNKQDPLKGWVRAKTGSLTQPVSVSSLVGYFRHPKHGLVAFAILENGIPGQPQPSLSDLRNGQDQALQKLLRSADNL